MSGNGCFVWFISEDIVSKQQQTFIKHYDSQKGTMVTTFSAKIP